MCIGDIGITPNSFWHEYTFADIQRKMYYFYRNKYDDFKNGWNQTRQIVYFIVMMNTTSKTKLSVTDIMEFEWDSDNNEKKREKVEMSKEETRALMTAYGMIN